MLKKLLPILLALLLCAAAAAEAPLTFTITGDMEFFSGPGTQYLQSAYHNTPPQPGETAQVLGCVRGADGQDWLFVRFTGHWFSQEHPVEYYLPASAVPELSGAPLLTFTQEPNALAVESARVYADPEGTNYDGYLTPTEAGVTVLAVQGNLAYIEAVNPYGFLRRGYISLTDLADVPGAATLAAAPEGTASLTAAHALPLSHRPAGSGLQALTLADGTLVVHYGTIPADAPWGEALAVISPDGQLMANEVYRTHDGAEESTIEFLLTSPEGFKICRYADEDMDPVHEMHYNRDGRAVRTDVRRYSAGDPRPRMSTAGFTVALGRSAYAEEVGNATIPLRVTAASGSSTQLTVDMSATLLHAAEYGERLLVALLDETGARFLLFGSNAAILADIRPSADLFITDLCAIPTADGRIALLLTDGTERWQVWQLDAAAGTLTPGPTVQLPLNRRITLLAADEEQLLIAVSGTQTQLLLITAEEQLLAATVPGTLLHASANGSAASLLLLEDSALRLEHWTLCLP